MRKYMLLALPLMALPMLAATVTPAAAQAKEPEILNNPQPKGFQVLGGGRNPPKPHKDETVQEGSAITLKASGTGNAWDVGINIPIQAPVKAGDNVTIFYWAKAHTLEPGKTTARISSVQLQLAQAPYTALFSAPAEVGTEWKLFQVKGKIDKDYAAKVLNASLHLNTGKHEIDIGPVAVLNYGQ
jgi:hypothetical protein